MSSDPRVKELEAFARESGLTLPYPADVIVYFEEQHRIVDLESGAVYDAITVTPEPSAKAVAYLLGGGVY
jgi:hypothetical protein